MMRPRALLLLAGLAMAAPAAAQQKPKPRVDTTGTQILARDTASARDSLRVSPTGAMLRSMLLPGWGQLAAGAPVRATVYFAGEAANLFMLTKTIHKLGQAKDREDMFRSQVRDSIRMAATEDSALNASIQRPGVLDHMVDDDSTVVSAHSLVKSRQSQREDWIALTVFWMLASGLDAFVTAHLSNFPGDVAVEPRHGGKGAEIRWTLPVRSPGWLR